METFLFTSESVNEGHPDKLCDQISDAVLDACLAQDADSKVACETCTKTNMVMVFGEITTKANVDYEKIVRETCRNIGFISDDVGLDADNCKVLVNIEQQSPDIAQGVHGHFTKRPEEIGAGDQGHMFGYATDETPELMPLSHVLATKLGARLTEVRKNGTCPWLRPDGKTQVTVEYYNENGAMVPVRVHTVLISTQHDETVTNDEIAADLKEHVIKPVVPEKYLDEKTIFHLNPSGRFVIGGPHGDAGLTGRKIIIDTYGGWGAHGGGAFSGKDPTKVDRSGAYIVRQAAKSIVANGLARMQHKNMETSASPPPPTTKPKLRIMCSYGGHIVPNPRSKSLCYIGGDTRILSIDPTTVSTLSSLTSHLAATLSLPAPLFLKYQLPRHDLLSLVSLSTDDDLLIFLNELRRLSNSASRIRLFVFFDKTHHQCKAIQHPKTESWFIDALESAKIVMQKGMRSNGLVGFEAKSQSQSECLSGGGSRKFLSCGVGGGGSVAAESIVLETSSSFGSTSSSASLSSLPSVRARDEDVMAGTLLENKVKVASGESIARERSVGVGNGISLSQTDAVINVASMENRVSYNYAESDIKLSDPNFSGIQVQKTVQASGYYPVTPQLDQLQQPKLQFVQVGTPYIPQNPVGMLPVSSYYPMYHPQLHQQQLQHLHYQPNQPYPIYILPAAPAQPYNLPMHGSSYPIAHGHPPLYPNAFCIPPQATQNEPIKAGVSSDFASRVYRPVHSEMPHHGGVPLIHVPYDGNQQQPSGVSEMQHEIVAIASRESPKYSNQPDNDPARDLIYKSQPSAPSLAYQSMTKDTIHLSEALTQFHIDNRKQQTGNLDSQ